jgi:hypothetical protein
MKKTLPECPDSDFSDRPKAADVLVREEPDDEEDEPKDDDDNNEEDDENGEQDENDEHDGYSEWAWAVPSQ